MPVAPDACELTASRYRLRCFPPPVPSSGYVQQYSSWRHDAGANLDSDIAAETWGLSHHVAQPARTHTFRGFFPCALEADRYFATWRRERINLRSRVSRAGATVRNPAWICRGRLSSGARRPRGREYKPPEETRGSQLRVSRLRETKRARYDSMCGEYDLILEHRVDRVST